MIGATGPVPAIAAVPSMFAAPDLLEPAKSALRLKQFADAAGRLAADPLAADPRAQYLLGALYLAGLGVDEDTQRARTLFTAAAAKGEPRAAYALAALAAHDSPVDEAAARAWLAKAAATGHAEAARLLQAGQLPLQVDPRVLATEPAVTLSMTIAAARRGDVDTLAALWPLLPKDANDAFHRSVLHHAAESGAAGSVRWLVAHDARVDAIDAQGITPLDAGRDGRARGRPGSAVAVETSRCGGGRARELGTFLCGTQGSRRTGRAPGGCRP
ncbi:MAG: SEL1-like repeat protein [Proteobacteria bacterium]|nr:SEL1-like repeat protein [Pseudomonadota bacterium]